MTDTEYRRYTTGELRELSAIQTARLADKRGNIWHPSCTAWGWAIDDGQRIGRGIPGSYRPCNVVARRLLRRLA
jgi:hypothetical protein